MLPGLTPWEHGDEKMLTRLSSAERPRSLNDLTAPIRSQIFFNMVGDLLRYSGANEVNVHLDRLRGVCRDLRDQVDEECLTFNYDDSCGLAASPGGDHEEIKLLNEWIRRHPRLKYFECHLRSVVKFRILLQDLDLPQGTRCSFVLEFKVSSQEIKDLFGRFLMRRLSVIPEEDQGWGSISDLGLDMLCLRSGSDDVTRSILAACPKLRGLQLVDSKLVCNPGINALGLTSLSLSGVVTMPDEQFSKLIAGCKNVRSLYIAKCHISNVTVALPRLNLLSITHCRQLTDQCVTQLMNPSANPNLRFVDLTEDRGLVSPAIAHPNLEMAWLMHCPQLTDQAVTNLFRDCPCLTAANLVQSSIENALICSPTLRTLELTTSQKLTDAAVTHLLQHCPSLTFLDVGHCCQLSEPVFEHPMLETILLSFCVNLRESAIVHLFANCPSLRYVELAVCMFDMTRFQRDCRPDCQVVVNFDF